MLARRRLLSLLLLAAAAPAGAQDAPPPPASPFGADEELPKPLTPEEKVAADKLFAEGKALLQRDVYSQGRAKFREFLKKYPGADEDLIREAEDRGGDNCLVGIEKQHYSGPPERRIDVELMGDGYTQDKFKTFAKEALSQLVEFWAEPLYDEYENYFNVWRFDLISKEDGVDELSAEERGMPVPPPDPKKPPKKKKPKEYRKYSTALNCVAAGPQNQVAADPEQVYRWRRYLECSDGLTIAFAKKGQLGMGGGGIATTGKKVAVVHEFGHAFVNLLDEYQGNPERPQGRIFAANAISTDDPDPRKPPPMEEIPWKHWLLLGKNSPVGVHLGGATYSTGVFRPAPGCAMNAGGGAPMCWVCREAGVLRIYSYLSPVDESGPLGERVTVAPGETPEFWVVPMAPKKHALQVEWYLQRVSTAPPPVDPAPPGDGGSFVRDERAAQMWKVEGERGDARRANPLPDGLPPGSRWKGTVKKLPTGGYRHSAVLAKLDPGGWRLTARVFDDTKIPGQPHPWVIKDVDRLREEWRSWTIEVPPAAAAPPPAPAPKR